MILDNQCPIREQLIWDLGLERANQLIDPMVNSEPFRADHFILSIICCYSSINFALRLYFDSLLKHSALGWSKNGSNWTNYAAECNILEYMY